MDWNLYQQDGIQKKIILDFGDYIFTKSDVAENLTHAQIVNPTGDFVIGLASTAQLTFDLENRYQLIPDTAITGKEFTYKAGVQTATASKKDLYKKIRKDIVCLGAVAYAGNLKAPYLTIYDLTGNILPAPQQPSQPVKSLFIVNGKLYCGHDNAPYLTVYSITGNTLTPLAAPALNPFKINKIQNYNKRSASFNMAGNILKEYFVERQTLLADNTPETTLVDFEERTTEFFQIGIFSAELPERKNDITISVTAYDRMKKFSVVIDAWNAGIKYPITAGNMLKSLCAHIGVTLATPTFLNSDYLIKKNYRGENVTGVQIVQYIAQMAACFAAVDEFGALHIRWYEDRGYTIDESSYTDVMIAGFATALVDKLQIKVTENDIGVIVPKDGAGTNALIIENNPLLYATSDAELRPMATNIYNAVTKFAYRPFSIKTIWGDPRRSAGDIVTVKTLKGQTIKTPIMNFKTTGINALKGEYGATGGQTRSKQVDAVNQKIQMLNGRTNEIVANVEKFSVTLTELKGETGKNSAQLLIQAGQIATKVEEIDYNGNTISSLINQTATNILIKAERVDIQGKLSAGDARFVSKSGNREIAMEDAEIVIKKDGVIMGQIWANRSQNGIGIEYRDSLWFYKTNPDGSSTSYASITGNGQLSCNGVQAGSGEIRTSYAVFCGRVETGNIWGTDIILKGSVTANGDVAAKGGYHSKRYEGWTGQIKDANGNTKNVRGGIITST